MPPRRTSRQPKKVDYDEEEALAEMEGLGQDEEDEEEAATPKPKPKRKPAKRKPKDKADSDEDAEQATPKKRAPKRKPKAEPKADPDEEEADPELRASEEKPKKKRTPAKPKRTEPFTMEDGWSGVPPGLLFRSTCSSKSQKVAAFDLDGTLVTLKSANDPQRGPRDKEDYRFLNKTVVPKVQQLHEDGYKLVILSNQGSVQSALEGVSSEKVRQRADLILQELGCPMTVVYATMKDEYRKPGKGMWDFFVREFCEGNTPDMASSFYVGDAAGRTGDFADSDKAFAEAAGLPFKIPEDLFGQPDVKPGGGSAPAVPDGPNAAMATAFYQLARHQESIGANAFGIRAVKKAAGIIAEQAEKITRGRALEHLEGIGKGTVAKINEFIATGNLAALQQAGVPLKPPTEKEAIKAEAGMDAFQFA